MQFCVEYARTRRSQCKRCGYPICYKELRIGKVITSPYTNRRNQIMIMWQHVHCTFDSMLNVRSRRVSSLREFQGWRSIRPSDQRRLQSRIDQLHKRISTRPSTRSSLRTGRKTSSRRTRSRKSTSRSRNRRSTSRTRRTSRSRRNSRTLRRQTSNLRRRQTRRSRPSRERGRITRRRMSRHYGVYWLTIF